MMMDLTGEVVFIIWTSDKVFSPNETYERGMNGVYFLEAVDRFQLLF